jgi:hypothetical protein
MAPRGSNLPDRVEQVIVEYSPLIRSATAGASSVQH